MNTKEIDKIRTARRCMKNQLIKCECMSCLNKLCPLNNFWDEKEVLEEKE